MKILVTGSEGNIGKRLVPYLESCGHTVFGIDIHQDYRPNYQVCDVTKPVDICGVFSYFHPEVVYHMAAMVSRVTCEQSPGITVETNVGGTNNIMQLCMQFDARLINFSTSEIYGNIGGILSESRTDMEPNNIYGVTKLMAEKLVNYATSTGLHAINIRPFMIYDHDESLGENRSAMIRFAENLVKGKKITVHTGAMRSWTHALDAVRIMERLAYYDANATVNIGSPGIVGMDYIAGYFCHLMGLQYEDYVEETPLPEKMTLTKIPDLETMLRIAPVDYEYDINTGMMMVLQSVKERLKR